jgi:hypothetical protein
MQIRATVAPDLRVRRNGQPVADDDVAFRSVVLPRLRGLPRRLRLDVMRALDLTKAAHELDVETCLLPHLADRGLLDGFTRFDPAAGNDGRKLRISGEVEDEELVRAGLGMLAGDVGGDRRARSQLFWARILAL